MLLSKCPSSVQHLKLLHNKTDIPESDIDSLCSELHGIRDFRNDIAHNPIAYQDENFEDHSKASILIVKDFTKNLDEAEKITLLELKNTIRQATKNIKKLLKLYPECQEMHGRK